MVFDALFTLLDLIYYRNNLSSLNVTREFDVKLSYITLFYITLFFYVASFYVMSFYTPLLIPVSPEIIFQDFYTILKRLNFYTAQNYLIIN